MEKQSYDHGLGEEALIGSTIGAYFDLMAQKQTSSPAIIDCAQNKTISYAHLNELTNSLALALLEIGIGKGDRAIRRYGVGIDLAGVTVQASRAIDSEELTVES